MPQKIVMDMDAGIKSIVEEIENNRVLEKIEKLTSQASKENPESAIKAQENILEVRKKIDPIIKSANNLLKWKVHKEWCDKNIAVSKKIIKDMDSLSPDYQFKFVQLIKAYETAVMKKDYKRTEEVAYISTTTIFKLK